MQTESLAERARSYIAALELPAQAVLVEHNGVALRRDEWPAHFLQENDRIEFIRIVAGG